jgi:hypothetical protein
VVAAQRLRDKGIVPADIVRVGVEVSPPNDMLFTPRAQRIAPQTAIDAKFSIPFVLAAALGAAALAALVGGSVEGDPALVITGVADRVPERIGHLVYLADADGSGYPDDVLVRVLEETAEEGNVEADLRIAAEQAMRVVRGLPLATAP